MSETAVKDWASLSDETLVTHAKAGDFDAFEQLVTRHEGRLYALAMHLLRQAQDAEDVVQTTFLSALEHLQDFREDASFGTWIRRIATNKALNLIRKRRTARSYSLDGSSSPDASEPIHRPEFIADWRADLSQTIERRELQRILDEAIDELPEKYRLVFVLRDIEGMSVAETAQTLGLSESNVKVRLLRARLKLRERLTRIFAEPGTEISPAEHHQHNHSRDERSIP